MRMFDIIKKFGSSFPFRIVDGVVDLETEVFTDDSDLISVVDGNSVIVTNSTASAFKDTNITVNTSNTEKTMVVSSKILYGTDNPIINITTLAGSALATINMALAETEYRQSFTPTDGGFIVKIWSSFSTAEAQSKEYYNFAVYEGDYVTGTPTLPTSQQPVVGNSYIDENGDLIPFT